MASYKISKLKCFNKIYYNWKKLLSRIIWDRDYDLTIKNENNRSVQSKIVIMICVNNLQKLNFRISMGNFIIIIFLAEQISLEVDQDTKQVSSIAICSLPSFLKILKNINIFFLQWSNNLKTFDIWIQKIFLNNLN